MTTAVLPPAVRPDSVAEVIATAGSAPSLSSPPRPGRLSLVVPVFNEEENLAALHVQINEAMSGLQLEYEVIYVDDGSRDESFAVLEALARTDSRVKVVRFRRNFGQTAAMQAGIRHAAGDVIIPLDADLQNDPADIPRLLAKLDEGFDVVSGWRKDRKDDIIRKIPSRLANGLISRVTGVPLHDYGCSLKAYRAAIMKDVTLYGEMHRFIPAYAAMVGGRVAEIPVRHHPRRAGTSKYGMGRLFRVLLDLLVVRFLGGYGSKPIYFFGGAGMASLLLAGVLWAIAVAQKLLSPGINLNRNPLFYLGILLVLMGMQFIMMGLLAEVNMRTYYESQGKPPYIVAETRNLEGDVAVAS